MACASRSIILVLLGALAPSVEARVACSIQKMHAIIRQAFEKCGPKQCWCNHRQMGMDQLYETHPAFFWGFPDANPYFYSNAHFPYWGYDSWQPNGWLTPGWWVW